MTPNPLRRFVRRFPALSRMLLISIGLTCAVFLAAKLYFHNSKPTIFLLGDSGIGNYRLDPGARLQDFLEKKNPGMAVVNWAEPGSTMADCFLQLERGILLSGKPTVAVIAISPDKFLDDDTSHRFTDDGANLRWIPWNAQGFELFRSLDHGQRNNAIVQQLSVPFYALSDALQAAWIHGVQWPWERAQMRNAGQDRRARIEKRSSGVGAAFGLTPIGDEAAFSSTLQARDCDFLVRSLHEQGIEAIMVLLPFGNPELLEKTWTPQGLANRDLAVERMKSWISRRNLAYVDFNGPTEIVHFPDAAWDDHVHLKDPQAFAYMTDRIATTIQGRLSRAPSRDRQSAPDASENHGTRSGAR